MYFLRSVLGFSARACVCFHRVEADLLGFHCMQIRTFSIYFPLTESLTGFWKYFCFLVFFFGRATVDYIIEI